MRTKKNWITAEFRTKGSDEEYSYETAYPLDGTPEEVAENVKRCLEHVDNGNKYGYSSVEYRVGHKYF